MSSSRPVSPSPSRQRSATSWSSSVEAEERIALSSGIEAGDRFQTLLGITGSGKSATIAWTIEQVQRPTLVLAPNKSLAAQLANELKEFFPDNRVEYFVSYYDYYQPEAYMPSSDTYIEKESSVNEAIDRMRHSATRALLESRTLNGQRNPLFEPVRTYQPSGSEEVKRVRKLCCLRYLLDEFDVCGNCPLEGCDRQARRKG